MPTDIEAALSLLSTAADAGYAPAQFDLGTVYMRDGQDADPTAALTWFRRAADQGYARAQVRMGAFYLGGLVVAKDSGAAVTWFRKAADQGFAPARFDMGAAYEYGDWVSQHALDTRELQRDCAGVAQPAATSP